MIRNPEFDAFREEAEAAGMLEALSIAAPGVRYVRQGRDWTGPCPACGGTDRFSLNPGKRVFHCRHCAIGADARGPVMLVCRALGIDYVEACERITRRPRPGRAPLSPAERQAMEAEAERRRADAEAAAAAAAREEERYRRDAVERGLAIWNRAERRWRGTPVEGYLIGRGLRRLVELPELRLALRHHPALGFYLPPRRDGAGRVLPVGPPIHTGPAMVAPMVDLTGQRGVHVTWVAPGVPPKHRPLIADPTIGEILPTKKMFGSKGCGLVALAGSRDAPDMVIGEGIENTLDAFELLLSRNAFDGAAPLVATGLDMGHLYGPGLGRDAAGRAAPDLDRACAAIPETVRRLWLIEDSNVRPWQTARFVSRWRRPGRTILAMRADGASDLNALRQGAA